MGHHGEHPFDVYDEETATQLRDLLTEKRRFTEAEAHLKSELGATGKFPDGKLCEHDEGEITFAIGHREGQVVLDFGKPVAWVGMSPQQAIALAASLTQHARDCRIIGSKAETRHKVTAKTE